MHLRASNDGNIPVVERNATCRIVANVGSLTHLYISSITTGHFVSQDDGIALSLQCDHEKSRPLYKFTITQLEN